MKLFLNGAVVEQIVDIGGIADIIVVVICCGVVLCNVVGGLEDGMEVKCGCSVGRIVYIS